MSDRDRKQIVAEVCVGRWASWLRSDTSVTATFYANWITQTSSHTTKEWVVASNGVNRLTFHQYVDREGGMLYILMEFCGGGDLQSIIKSCKRSNTLLPEDTIWSYISQLASALDHCHRRGGVVGGAQKLERRPSQQDLAAANQQILHRDLKPENGENWQRNDNTHRLRATVFLDNSGSLKLGDFGLSKATQIGEFAKTYVGVS